MSEPGSSKSWAEIFRALPSPERNRRLQQLSETEAEALLYDWDFWARPKQRLPEGAWRNWLVMAGRGFGKTRVGAETVRIWARDFAIVNLIGATADDARDIMIEGESGLLATCPKWERPLYVASKRQLQWSNGAKSLIFTADEPERLRGKQHMKIWADELAAWRYQTAAWDQAMFGLRLGANPQVVVTTTPKPTRLVREIAASQLTHVTRGTTYENRSNLADAFYADIITKYEGTRLGRQELNAELLEDNPGALWHLASIDADRVAKLPELVRIVVGIDPAASAKKDSDETGIVAAGRDNQSPPHFYVLDDLSLIASPDTWGKAAVGSYRAQRADRIVAEVNNGGDMVEAVIRHVDPNVSYKAVHASRGKAIRAEPIAALYEQHRVHHCGTFGKLEDQMCDFDPTSLDPDAPSPDRMDALVWALTELAEGTGGLLSFWQSAIEQRKNEKAKEKNDTPWRTRTVTGLEKPHRP